MSLEWMDRRWAHPLANYAYRQDVWSRIRANIRETEDGCWEWMRYRTPDGYGKVSVKSRMIGVHQVALAISRNGTWPEPYEVDHLCRNRACCNPDHLELVTPLENYLRGLGPQRLGDWQRVKTECPSGHPYDRPNTYIHPVTGHRACRACRARIERRRIAVRRAGL